MKRLSTHILFLIFNILFIACKKENAIIVSPDPDDTITVTTTVDTPFTLIFIGDSEPRMRDNTNEEVAQYVRNIIAYKTSNHVYFDADSGKYKVNPEIVLLAGDISADRSTSIQNDMPIWQPLYDNGIAFIAGFGNHDWEPDQFGDDGPGYSVAGHNSNESTKAFCRETYKKSAQLTTLFTYTEIRNTSSYGPITFYAKYKNTNIYNFNTFLYQPSYYYPNGWPLTCNLLGGGAGCQIYVSAENQIANMENLISVDSTQNYIFFQHYPFSTNSSWWNDYDASSTSVTEKKERLMEMIIKNKKSVFMAGHNHVQSVNSISYKGSIIKEYIAPYFGGSNGVDTTQGGKFYAFLISPAKGILEVKILK